MAGPGEFGVTGEHPSLLPEVFLDTLRTTGGDPALVRAAHPELVTDFGDPRRELGTTGTDFESVISETIMPGNLPPLRVRGCLAVHPSADRTDELALISQPHEQTFRLGPVDQETAAAVRSFGVTPIDAEVAIEWLPSYNSPEPGRLARIFGIQEPLPTGAKLSHRHLAVIEGIVKSYRGIFAAQDMVGRAALRLARRPDALDAGWIELARDDGTGFGALGELSLGDFYYPQNVPVPFDRPHAGDRVSLLLRGARNDIPRVQSVALLSSAPEREQDLGEWHERSQREINLLASERNLEQVKQRAADIIENSLFIYGERHMASRLTPLQKELLRDVLHRAFAQQPQDLPIAARLLDPSVENEFNGLVLLARKEQKEFERSLFALSAGEYATLVTEAIDNDINAGFRVDLCKVALTPRERYVLAEAVWNRCLDDPARAATRLRRLDTILQGVPYEVRGNLVHDIVQAAPPNVRDSQLLDLLNLEIKELADPRQSGLPPTPDDLERWKHCRESLDRLDTRTPGNLPDRHTRNHLNALAAAYMPYVVLGQQ